MKYLDGRPFTPFFHMTFPFDVQELSIRPSVRTAIPYDVSTAGAIASPPMTDCQSGFWADKSIVLIATCACALPRRIADAAASSAFLAFMFASLAFVLSEFSEESEAFRVRGLRVEIEEEELLEGAVRVEAPAEDGIVLTQNSEGEYVFSLHVSVFPEAKWQGLLGSDWHLLPAQDYTACSAVNFEPGEEFRSLKLAEIARTGFADFIGWPTPIGSKYETDPLLHARTAKMQVFKHQRKLEVLKKYPEGYFRKSEEGISEAWLKFIGNDENSLKRLYALDELAKSEAEGGDDAAVAERAMKMVVDYVCGDQEKIDEWVETH